MLQLPNLKSKFIQTRSEQIKIQVIWGGEKYKLEVNIYFRKTIIWIFTHAIWNFFKIIFLVRGIRGRSITSANRIIRRDKAEIIMSLIISTINNFFFQRSKLQHWSALYACITRRITSFSLWTIVLRTWKASPMD